jgi:L-serine dehydratase
MSVVSSVFDLFKIGVGPSSSHTMGPMTAACGFVEMLGEKALLDATTRVQAELYGSLALTGKGHATDRAVLLGLSGERPHSLDPDEADTIVDRIRATGKLKLGGRREIAFDEPTDLRFLQRERLPHHSNGMRFTAMNADGRTLDSKVYYSVGGGAIVDEAAIARNAPPEGVWDIPYNYRSADELLEIAEREGLTIADIARANERAGLSDPEINRRLDAIAGAMSACIDRGIAIDGILPGGLKVKRRAPALYRLLIERAERTLQDPLTVLDWVNLWALAVNEENAAGGRVVTAPTNGAAGIVPAVLRYYQRFTPRASDEGVYTFLLTAAAIGSLFKENASKWAARARSGSPARWPPRVSPPLSAARRRRWRMRPRSAWSIISASPAILSPAWSRCPASSGTRSARSRRSKPRAWPWSATAPTLSRSIR